jgi:unsaturated chondroitin disaccharide hydrolase
MAVATGCSSTQVNVNKDLDYCIGQATKTLTTIPVDSANLPRSIEKGQTKWRYVNYKDWTSGFWPGLLWYAYEYTKDAKWKTAADRFSIELISLSRQKANDHDLGFQLYCSMGNGYRLTGDTLYKKVLLATADTLATLFNPTVGTLLSWPGMVTEQGWPHNTIIDNMMNLELLLWASQHGGDKKLYDIAVQHATTTMHNHFRPDHSAYHVVVYDTVTGKKIKGVTHQGFSDASMWARGQSWAIYGFTMMYRETKRPEFLDFAQKVADVYLLQLPEDMIPYWDFDAPDIPNAPKDASAAAITASALLELCTLVPDKAKAKTYRKNAEKMLTSLSAQYHSGVVNHAFLLHATGHKPKGGEVDASIIYGDYYYLEALIRLKNLNK